MGRIFFLAVACVVLAPVVWAADAPAPEQALAELRNRAGKPLGSLDAWMKENQVPGVSIALIHDFEIAWTYTAGVANADTGARVDAETLFQAASISKPVSAAAAHLLAVQGALDLDAPINDILKSWQLPAHEFTDAPPVSARLLLSHRAGTNASGFDGYEADAPLPTLLQILDGAPPAHGPAVRVEKAPGAKFRYSGGGTTIMQLALSDITGEAPEAVVQRLVLDPLGMKRSYFSQPLEESLRANAAAAHFGRGRVMQGGGHVYPELFAAGLWTTPTDLARFAIAIQHALRGEASPIPQPVAIAMTTQEGDGPTSPGFFVDGDWFYHGGSNHGFRCLLKAHKTQGYGFVVMTNAERGDALGDFLFHTFAAACGWE